MQDEVPHLRGQVPISGGQVPPVLFGEQGDFGQEVRFGLPGQNGSLRKGAVRVDRELLGEVLVAPEPGAVGAGPERAVEGEEARLDLRDGDVAVRAGVVLRQHVLRPALRGDQDVPARELQCGLHGLRDARTPLLRHLQPVDDHLDVVALLLVQLDVLVQPQDRAVDADARIALLPRLAEQVAELALLAPDERGEDLHAGTVVVLEDQLQDLVDGIADDRLSAMGAVGHPDAAVEQAQVVVDLGDGPYDGTRVVARPLLFDGDGGGQAGDVVHIRLLLDAQKLARVGRQGLHVAPLPLGIERVERQGRLAGPRRPRYDHQPAPRNVHAHVLEVVFPGPFDADIIVQ